MKRRTFFQVASAGLASLFMSQKQAQARDAYYLSYDKLTEKADLIVIAKAESSKDVTEPFNFLNIEVIGMETLFTTIAIFKDTRDYNQRATATEQKAILPEKAFALYHYRLADPNVPLVDGPMLVSFDPKNKAQYLMFLQNGDNGQYTPLTTQYDADFSIEKLRFAANN